MPQEEKPKPAPQAKPSPARRPPAAAAVPSASSAWRLCTVVPVYDQPLKLEGVLRNLKKHGLPVILVDDGSHEPTRSLCDRLAPLCIRVVHLPRNGGKGGAVMTGFRAAGKLGFTHVLQVDADGQIDISSLPSIIRLSQKHPSELICGYPKYDGTVPKARLFGRCLTNFWCSVNGLSLSVVDAMCGLRVYPLEPTLEVCANASIGRRMEFDPEILVRLLWAGVRLRNVPVPVTYPEDGISHFHPFGDNARISWMHTKLFVRMAATFPIIIWSRIVGRSPCTRHPDKPARRSSAPVQKAPPAVQPAPSAAARAARAAAEAKSAAERGRAAACRKDDGTA